MAQWVAADLRAVDSSVSASELYNLLGSDFTGRLLGVRAALVSSPCVRSNKRRTVDGAAKRVLTEHKYHCKVKTLGCNWKSCIQINFTLIVNTYFKYIYSSTVPTSQQYSSSSVFMLYFHSSFKRSTFIYYDLCINFNVLMYLTNMSIFKLLHINKRLK